MTAPTLTYDPEANALYIRFSTNRIAETVALSDSVYVDLDADGDPVGFEVLNADPALLAKVPALPDAAALRDLVKPDAASRAKSMPATGHDTGAGGTSD